MTAEIVRRCDFCLAIAGECGVSVFECEACGGACCDEHSVRDGYGRVECTECLPPSGFDLPPDMPVLMVRGGCEAADFLPRDFVEKCLALGALAEARSGPVVIHVLEPLDDRFHRLAELAKEINMLAVHAPPSAHVRVFDPVPMQSRGMALAASIAAAVNGSTPPRGFSNYVERTRSGSPNWLKIALVSQRR